MADRFALTLETCDKDLKPILTKVFNLYLASLIEKNLGWFVISCLLQPSGLDIIKLTQQSCVHSLALKSLAICESFGITDTMLSAPFALDWVGYNSNDNQGSS